MARDRIADVLKDARHRAGLTQRELARRARTAQSVVARIELGEASPTWHTLTRLLAAAGFDLDAQLAVRPVARSHRLADVARIRRLTPEQRPEEVASASRLDDTVRSKKAADRPQDRQDVLVIREMQRGRKR